MRSSPITTKSIAIVQSNYIPWKGYFDIIHDVDAFVFYDDVQFTKNDWRNRNKIKTPRGAEWLSIGRLLTGPGAAGWTTRPVTSTLHPSIQ